MSIYKKLLDLQKQGIALKKDANNPFFKSKYITLDNIIETYNPLFSELEIVCFHCTKENKLITTLFDTESESKIESEFNIYTNDPQKQGSEITYGKRYNLGQLLNIQTDEDDDGNQASSGGNTKQFFPEDNDLPWIGDTNIQTLKETLEKGVKISLADVRKKYKISKVNLQKLKDLGII